MNTIAKSLDETLLRKFYVVMVFVAALISGVLVWKSWGAEKARPLTFGEKTPSSFSVNPLLASSSSSPTMIVVSGTRTAMGDRAFRYIATRTSQGLPILPTLMIAPASVAGGESSAGIVCSGLCRLIEDKHKAFAEMLGVGDAPFHLFVVGNDHRVLFSADLADPQDIEQLNEKFLTGHVRYPSKQTPDVSALIGQQLSSFSAQRLSDGAHVDLYKAGSDSPKRILILTARCPDCSLDGLVKASSTITQTEGQNVSLLFSSRFAQWQIKDLQNRYKTETQSYQATASIPGIEDLASLTVFTPTDVCLLTLSPTNTILQIEPMLLKGGKLIRVNPNAA